MTATSITSLRPSQSQNQVSFLPQEPKIRKCLSLSSIAPCNPQDQKTGGPLITLVSFGKKMLLLTNETAHLVSDKGRDESFSLLLAKAAVNDPNSLYDLLDDPSVDNDMVISAFMAALEHTSFYDNIKTFLYHPKLGDKGVKYVLQSKFFSEKMLTSYLITLSFYGFPIDQVKQALSHEKMNDRIAAHGCIKAILAGHKEIVDLFFGSLMLQAEDLVNIADMLSSKYNLSIDKEFFHA